MANNVPSQEFLAGEIHALLSFALALANSHPNRALLAEHFHAASQTGLAKIETKLVSDQVVVGFQYAAKQIADCLPPPGS